MATREAGRKAAMATAVARNWLTLRRFEMDYSSRVPRFCEECRFSFFLLNAMVVDEVEYFNAKLFS